MDTVMDLTVYGDEKLLDDAQSRILDLESKLSTTNPQSEVYNLNENSSAVVSDDIINLLKHSLELCKQTKGALDLSIYPIVKEWGFTTGNYHIPDNNKISELLKNVNYNDIKVDFNKNKVVLSDKMQIDFGSVAKGYTGDEIISLFKKQGVKSALLNLGGNVQALGAKPDGKPWNIAIRDPFSEKNAVAVEIIDKAVITSGVYERYFEQDGNIYWHIIDSKTGFPAQNGLVSVSIIGENGLTCDALSTALFVMGKDNAIKFWKEYGGFDAVFIEDNGDISITQGLKFTAIDDYENKKINIITKD